MAKSRYSESEIIDGRHYGSYSLPIHKLGYREMDLLAGVKTFEYVYAVGDRLDTLAARFFSQEAYWWVIALVNGISYPFASGGLTAGRVLRIPTNVRDVFEKIFG